MERASLITLVLFLLGLIVATHGSRHRQSRPLRLESPRQRPRQEKKEPTSSLPDFAGLLSSLMGGLGRQRLAIGEKSATTQNDEVDPSSILLSTLGSFLGSFGANPPQEPNPKPETDFPLEALQLLANVAIQSGPDLTKTPSEALYSDQHHYRPLESFPAHKKPEGLTKNPFSFLGPLLLNALTSSVGGFGGNLDLEDIDKLAGRPPSKVSLGEDDVHPDIGHFEPILENDALALSFGLGVQNHDQPQTLTSNPLLLAFSKNSSLAPVAPLVHKVLTQGLGLLFNNSNEDHYPTSGIHTNLGNTLHDLVNKAFNRSVESLIFPPKRHHHHHHHHPHPKHEPKVPKPPGYTCKERVVMVEEIVYEESVKCEDMLQKECFPSYKTVYEPMKVEECDTIFKKVCYIAFKDVARDKSVKICQAKKSRDCNRRGATKCTYEKEFVCETFTDPAMRTACRTEMEDACDYSRHGVPMKCRPVPKRRCRGRQARAHEYGLPQTECYNFPRKVCGPEICPIVELPEVCEVKNQTVIQEVPAEECKMEPQRDCQIVTKIVPKLDTQEDCVEVPKEVCNTVRNPVQVKKPVVRTWCGVIPDMTPKEPPPTKLLVALGCDEFDQAVKSVTVINLGADHGAISSNYTIIHPADYIGPDHGAVGGFVGGKPWICGGIYTSPICAYFDPEKNKWNPGHKLITRRFNAAGFVDHEDNLWIIGGQKVYKQKYLDTIEIMVAGQKIIQGPNLPFAMSDHCVVNLNTTHMMVIGGVGIGLHSSEKVFFMNKKTGMWNETASLTLGRFMHACGKIETERGIEIVVAGGLSHDGLSHGMPVEVFSFETMSWRIEGILNDTVLKASMLEFNSTLILIGGQSLNAIIELDPLTLEWHTRSETLDHKIGALVAMLLPDAFIHKIEKPLEQRATNLLTVAGYNEHPTNLVELLPLQGGDNVAPTQLNTPARYPVETAGTVGAFFNHGPMVCSGASPLFSHYCLTLDPWLNTWEKSVELLESRAFPAGTIVGKHYFWISGGGTKNGLLDTIEIVKKSEPKSVPGPDLPYSVKGHCLVAVNATYLMLIGGNVIETQWSNRVMGLNVNTSEWKPLEPLMIGRRFHGCGMVHTSDRGLEIVVVGGNGQDDIMGGVKMEIYSLDSKIWRFGQGIELDLFGTSVVQYNGTLLAMGDVDSGRIYELEKDQMFWQRRQEFLQVPRSSMTAMLIPNNVVEAIAESNEPIVKPISGSYFILSVTSESVRVIDPLQPTIDKCTIELPMMTTLPNDAFITTFNEQIWICADSLQLPSGQGVTCMKFNSDSEVWEEAIDQGQLKPYKPTLGGAREVIPWINEGEILLLRPRMNSFSDFGTTIIKKDATIHTGPNFPPRSTEASDVQLVSLDASNSLMIFPSITNDTLANIIVDRQGMDIKTFFGPHDGRDTILDCLHLIAGTQRKMMCLISSNLNNVTRLVKSTGTLGNMNLSQEFSTDMLGALEDAQWIQAGESLFVIARGTEQNIVTIYEWDPVSQALVHMGARFDVNASPTIVGTAIETSMSPC